MKRIISAILILCCFNVLWTQQLPVESKPEENKGYQMGYMQGSIYGEKEKQDDWMMVGFGGTLLGGCIGTGIVWFIAGGSSEMPSFIPSGDEQYRYGFVEGYKKATSDKKQSAAISGGLIGLGVIAMAALIIFSPWGND